MNTKNNNQTKNEAAEEQAAGGSLTSVLQNIGKTYEEMWPSKPTLQPDGTWQMWAVWNPPGPGWRCIGRVGTAGQMECWATRDKAVVDAWYAARANEEYAAQPSI
jgi:hypothetical protein